MRFFWRSWFFRGTDFRFPRLRGPVTLWGKWISEIGPPRSLTLVAFGPSQAGSARLAPLGPNPAQSTFGLLLPRLARLVKPIPALQVRNRYSASSLLWRSIKWPGRKVRRRRVP